VPALLVLAGCASVTERLPPPPQVGLGDPNVQAAYRLQPGDVIELHFIRHPELDEQAVVGPDNRVTFECAEGLVAGGQTLNEVTTTAKKSCGENPGAAALQIILRSNVGTRVYVTGEVSSPSEVIVNGPLSALSAITRAGGFKMGADKGEVVLVRRDEENRPHLYALDLSATLKGQKPENDVLLQPYDILYVPRDRPGNLSLVIERIRVAIPFGTSVNYGYYLNSPGVTP
jgi:protein involved in polysaccharide export with SLBB domain